MHHIQELLYALNARETNGRDSSKNLTTIAFMVEPTLMMQLLFLFGISRFSWCWWTYHGQDYFEEWLWDVACIEIKHVYFTQSSPLSPTGWLPPWHALEWNGCYFYKDGNAEKEMNGNQWHQQRKTCLSADHNRFNVKVYFWLTNWTDTSKDLDMIFREENTLTYKNPQDGF